MDAYTNSETLARFMYHILEVPKSDEPMRVPLWIFRSPDSVKLAYLKQAFDMEGTILKKLQEIRFISKDEEFVMDLQCLLTMLGISAVVKPRVGGYDGGRQYRLSIYRRENFVRFQSIGFRIPMLQERFRLLIAKYGIAPTNFINGTCLSDA